MSPMLRLLRAAVHVVMPVFTVAVLLLTSPAWRAELELRAQTCSPQIRDPECSPLHAPTALITPHIVTTADNHVRITVEVADAVILDATDFSLTQNGTAVSILMTWTGKSGRGWVEPILVSGLNKFLVNVKNFQGTPAKDSAMVTYAPPPPQTAPSFSLTNFSALHHNNFRPGEPCAGCTATLSYAIPAYFSLDLPRSLSLLYSSATAAPTGYVVLGVRQGGTDTVRAHSVKLRRLYGDTTTYVQFLNGSQELFYQPAGGPQTTVLAAQFDASAMVTGSYPFLAEVRSFYSTSPGTVGVTATDTIRVHINNQINSPLGRGVGWAGIPRVGYSASGVYAGTYISYGDGSVVDYMTQGYNADSAWMALPTGVTRRLTYLAPSATFRTMDPDGSFMIFSYYGLLLASGDRFGDTTRYAWDNTERLTGVTDPLGKKIAITYQVSGARLVASITDSVGMRTSTMAYDGSSRLTSITRPDGQVAFAGAKYDSQHRLVAVTTPLGAVDSFTYSPSGGNWLRSVRDSMPGDPHVLTSKIRPALDTLFPPSGMATSLSSRWSPGPNTTLYTGQSGSKSEVTNDRYGLMTLSTVTDPLGHAMTTQVQRDSLGRPAFTTSSSLNISLYTYTGSNLTGSFSGGLQQRFTYTSFSQPDSVFVNGVLSAKYTYSGATATLASVTQDSTSTTSFTWDAHGRLLTQTSPLGAVTTIKYEGGGLKNQDTVVTSNGTTTVLRDAIGRVVRRTAPVVGSDSLQYDVLNAVTWVRDPLGNVTRHRFAMSTLTDTVVDAKNQVYRTTIDRRGRPVRVTDATAAARSEKLTYNALGQVATDTTRRGDVILHWYDALGRDSIRIAGADTARFKYDTTSNTAGKPANGWMVAWNAASRDSLVFDEQGRLGAAVSVRSGATLTVASSYDQLTGQRNQVLWRKNADTVDAINLSYDAFGRLWYQGAPSGASTRLRYAATGVLDSILASGISLKQGYAASTGQLTSVAVTGSNAFPARTYTYDALGRMSSRQWGGWDSSEARFLAYDNAGRLKAWRDTSARNYYELVCTATDPDPMAINSCLSWSYVLNNPHAYVRGDTTIAYDAVGNRTDGSGTQVDQGNRLSGWRGYAITFDSAGNVTTRNKANDNLSLYWNALGQLDSARRNGVVTTFKYDAFGRRVQKVSGGTTTNFLLDGDVTLAELDGSWAAQRVYSYWPGTDRPHSVKVGSSKYTYLYEEPGNVVALVNSSGTLVNTYQYDPWGADVGTTSSVAQPFRYTGRELDSETGLYYYRARYYDPGMGRFVSEDPVGLAGGINAYAYVGNDPADQSDPFGLKGGFHCPFGQRVVANSDGTPGCEPGTGFPARLDEVRVWGYYGFDWQRDHGQRTIGARDPWGDPVRREADPGLWERMQADPSCRSAVTQAALSMVVDAFGVKEVLV